MLVQVLSNLDIIDLRNFVLTNNKLLSEARSIYKRRFASTSMILTKDYKSFKPKMSINRANHRIDTVNATNILLFFWALDKPISDRVTVDYVFHCEKYQKMYEKLFAAISKYGTALDKIQLHGFPKGVLKKFLKPLPQIKHVNTGMQFE